MKLLGSLGCEFDRASDQAADLPRQLDPAHGDESLSDWERVLDLPDDCGPVPVTLEDRRRAVMGRLQAGGLLSRDFYVELARSQGYAIEIEELNRAPFRCGTSRCGDSLGTEAGIFAWTVVAKTRRRHAFRTGQSQCGEALGSLRDPLLECVLRRAAPAHTALDFRYEFIGRQPGDNDPGTRPLEGECWWRVGQGQFGPLRIYTEGGDLVLGDEVGGDLNVKVDDGEFYAIDELGQSLRVAIACEELDGCQLPILSELGAPLQWPTANGDLFGGTANGLVALGVTGDQVTFLDEVGDPLRLRLTCGEVAERWWQTFDANSGGYLNVRTIDGRLMATLEDGDRVALADTGQPFTVLDEAGFPLTIPLSAAPA